MDLISKRTRNAFREVMVGFVLREISMIFDSADLTPIYIDIDGVSGQRRTLVEQYYANLNFELLSDVKKLARAYSEVVYKLEESKSHIDDRDVQKTIDSLIKCMEQDDFKYEAGNFVSHKLDQQILNTSSIVELSLDSIMEHLNKVKNKIALGDNSGAISNAYTLIEQFLKELLKITEINFNQDEGDIRSLYNLIKEPLNLNPGNPSLENHLKSILGGIQKQIAGLYILANKASDRHARVFNPQTHHAKLAMNVAFTFCEFLLDSYKYQQNKKILKGVDAAL